MVQGKRRELLAERQLCQDALREVRRADPADDPQEGAQATAELFLLDRIASLSKEIESWRNVQLVIDEFDGRPEVESDSPPADDDDEPE